MSTEVDQDARKFVKLQGDGREALKGWLLVEDRRSVCLTEEGAALLRPS